MTLEEQLTRRKYAVRLLDSAANLFDRWLVQPNLAACRVALREKTRALVEHDRLMTGRY